MKQDGRELSQTLSFWFRQKYNLPPNDPRFLDLTLQDLETEYWAVHYFNEPEGKSEEFEDDDFDMEAEIAAIEARALEKERQREAEAGPPDPGDWEDLEIEPTE